MKNIKLSSLFTKIDKETIIVGILFIISLCIIYLIMTTGPGEYPEDYTDTEYIPPDTYSTPSPEDKEQSLIEMEHALNESANYNLSEMEKDMEMLEDTLENVSKNQS